MLVGYARVSTAEQNPDHQIDALLRAGVARDDIHVDHASGAKASRPKLDLILQILRDGDILVVTRFDRLGRSVLHLVTLGSQLRDRGVGLKVLEQGIDTATAEGRAMFGMLSVLAELQRELIVANTRDGLAVARARGRRGGRPARLTPDQAQLAQRLYDGGEHTVAQIAAILTVPRSTIYGHLDKTTVGTRPRAQKTATSPSGRRPARAHQRTGHPGPARAADTSPPLGRKPPPSRPIWPSPGSVPTPTGPGSSSPAGTAASANPTAPCSTSPAWCAETDPSSPATSPPRPPTPILHRNPCNSG